MNNYTKDYCNNITSNITLFITKSRVFTIYHVTQDGKKIKTRESSIKTNLFHLTLFAFLVFPLYFHIFFDYQSINFCNKTTVSTFTVHFFNKNCQVLPFGFSTSLSYFCIHKYINLVKPPYLPPRL